MHKFYLEENYLETIYIISLEKEEVRNIDISKKLRFAKPSVTVAIQKLVDKDYVTYGEDKIVRLTKKGKEIAKKTYERHVFLTKMLCNMGINKRDAEKEACRIEHVLSDDSFEKIKIYFKDKIK